MIEWSDPCCRSCKNACFCQEVHPNESQHPGCGSQGTDAEIPGSHGQCNERCGCLCAYMYVHMYYCNSVVQPYIGVKILDFLSTCLSVVIRITW